MNEPNNFATLDQAIVSDTMWAILKSVKTDDMGDLYVMVSALAKMEDDVVKILHDFFISQLLKEE